nr:MAG TPA: hypothetical protein [Caudoviricetes sp.]
MIWVYVTLNLWKSTTKRMFDRVIKELANSSYLCRRNRLHVSINRMYNFYFFRNYGRRSN